MDNINKFNANEILSMDSLLPRPSSAFSGGVATELIRQTAGAEERNANEWTVQCPDLPDKANVQIEHARRVGEKRHDLSLDGNAVLVDLVVEWKPTKHERPRVEGQVLGSFLPLLSDEPNGFESLEAALSDPY